MNNYQGDLADIVRASGSNINIDSSATITTATATINNEQMSNGQFVSSPKLYPFSDPLRITNPASMFPFYDVSLENNRIEGAASLRQLPVLCPIQISPNTTTDHDIPCGRRCNSKNNHDSCKGQVNKLPITQVSAVSSSRVNTNAAHHRLMSSQMNMNNINVSSSISPKDIGLLDTTAGLQISSPRNPGIKRRKSQAKKVVCIPAPAAANSRQTGEVVPSDLWAWRKYGQKPIKGSPYPRGYYRCSSSKGCSARKQVERSRTNANMLVITYTSEHNHPWPTQRNALAGSTRSQLFKSSGAVGSSESLQPTSGQLPNGSQTRTRNDTNNVIVKEDTNNDNAKKEERGEEKTDAIEVINDDKEEYDLADSYRPIMGEPNNISEQPDQDFFADLVDHFEGNHDPLNLLFTQQGKLALDPFGGLFDWGTPDSTNITSTVQNNDQNPSTSSGQGKKES